MNDTDRARVLAEIQGTVWAALPEAVLRLREQWQAGLAIGGPVAGAMATIRALEDHPEAALVASAAPMRRGAAVAVIPVYGFISPKPSFWGGTAITDLRGAFRQAMADPGVKALVLDIDSPGGSASGVEEFATEIYRARGQKPMVAVANDLMASAAYWIGAAADEVVAAPGALVGSIGVWTMHQDLSKMAEQLGIDVTLISAGKYKTEGNPFEPLGDEARAHLQEEVDDIYAAFVTGVASSRGATEAAVRNGYGQGRALTAHRAATAGLVDRVGTLDQVLSRFAGRSTSTTSAAADTAVDDQERRRRQRSAEFAFTAAQAPSRP